MTGSEFLDAHRSSIVQICRDYGVTSLRVFGSVLTDRWDEASDLDFVAKFGAHPLGCDKFKQVMGFTLAIEDLTRRKVDLYEVESVQSPWLITEISRAVELYAA